MLKKLLLLKRLMLSAILLSVCLSAQAAPASILVFGDSLSAGYGIRVETGWVALLQQRLAAQQRPYRTVNASVSGETSSGGRVRLPGLLSIHKPAIVILALGANDGLRGLPIAQMRNNLLAMIEAVQQAKAKVLLVGMQIPPNYGPSYTQAFSSVYTDLAKQKKLPLVPFLLAGVALDNKLMQADNLHPNALAQERLLNTVWPVLQPMLQ